ncbi:hypothetical protein IJM86_08800 [bacterium]|nr:hypothetical protein [bacterium]
MNNFKEGLNGYCDHHLTSYEEAIDQMREGIYNSLDDMLREELELLMENDKEMQNFLQGLFQQEEQFDISERLNSEEKIKLYLIFRDKNYTMQEIENFSKGFLDNISFKNATQMNSIDFSNFFHYNLFKNTDYKEMIRFVEALINKNEEAIQFYDNIQEWDDCVCDMSQKICSVKEKQDKE